MKNKLTEQEFDKIAGELLNETSKSLNDLRSVLFNGSESSASDSIIVESDEKNKEFLTFEEARYQAENYDNYQEGVYDYRIKGKGRTLVEHGKVLIRGADYVHWYAKGVYRYEIIGKGCKLIEDGKVLIKGVDWVDWYAKGVYRYGIKGKGRTLVEDGKVLVEGANYVRWFKKGVYKYEINNEGCTLVEDGKVLFEGADYVHWFEKGFYKYKMEGGDWVEINNNK